MKLIILLSILIFIFISCDRNPTENSVNVVEEIKYNYVVKVNLQKEIKMIEMNNISHNDLLNIFKSKTENELISLLEEVLVYFDTSPLENSERELIDSAINEYNLGQTVKWQN